MLTPFAIIEYHAEISSTNDRVLELLRTPGKPKLPCLIVAERQTAGRGRGGKSWWSGKGALMMSIGFELTPEGFTRNQLPKLSPATAQSVINVLKRYLPNQNFELHLPNDVYVDGKKISGILLESPTPKYAVIGIGINVNNRLSDVPMEWQNELVIRSITSTIELCGHQISIPKLISELVHEINDAAHKMV